jgi:hypothetical protein
MDPELVRQIHQLTGAAELSDADFIAISQLIAGTHKTRKIDLGTLVDYAKGSGGPGGIDLAPNSGLAFEDGKLTTKFNTLIPDVTDNVEVGGAGATGADYWKTQNFVEAFNKILFPDLLPTYTIPTIELSGSQSGVREIGTSLSQSLVLTAVKNDAGVFNFLDIRKNGSSLYSSNSLTAQTAPDLINQYNYTNSNNPNYKYIINYTDNFVVSEGVTTWLGRGNYLSGQVKKNNKGVNDSRIFDIRNTQAPQSADTNFSSNNITVTGIYPYFWGKKSTQPTASDIAADIENSIANKVLSLASEDISVNYNANSEYIWLAVPASYTQKTLWYHTAFNSGNIGVGNFILAPVEHPVNSPNSLWTGITYKIYISAWASNTESVTIFKN